MAVCGLHRPSPCGSRSCSRGCITLHHHRRFQPLRLRRRTRTAEKADGGHRKKKMQRKGRHDERLRNPQENILMSFLLSKSPPPLPPTAWRVLVPLTQEAVAAACLGQPRASRFGA